MTLGVRETNYARYSYFGVLCLVHLDDDVRFEPSLSSFFTALSSTVAAPWLVGGLTI
jgi:hypothetical protein